MSLSHGARSDHGNMRLPTAARETLRVGRTDGQPMRVARAGRKKAGSTGAHGADAEPRRGPGGRPGRWQVRPPGRRRPPPGSQREGGGSPSEPAPGPAQRPSFDHSAVRHLLQMVEHGGHFLDSAHDFLRIVSVLLAAREAPVQGHLPAQRRGAFDLRGGRSSGARPLPCPLPPPSAGLLGGPRPRPTSQCHDDSLRD